MIMLTLFVSAFLILFSLLLPYFTKILIDNVYPNKDANPLFVVLASTALIITHLKPLYLFIRGCFQQHRYHKPL